MSFARRCARYAESAAVTRDRCAGSGSFCDGESDAAKFGEALYDAEPRGELPEARRWSLGWATRRGRDLQARRARPRLGGGIDVILSAKRVGKTGSRSVSTSAGCC